VRGIKSGAIVVVALGLLAGSAVGVAAQHEVTDPTAPTWVTGTVGYAPSCVDPERTTEADVVRERGHICAPQQWTSDDPRLGGAATLIWNADVYRLESESYSIVNALYDIHDDAGGWSCRNANGLDLGSGLFTDPVQGTDRLTCLGYGGNEGLNAILVTDFRTEPRTFEGIIFPGEVPPLPELPAE
jgi:hypothetical protein